MALRDDHLLARAAWWARPEAGRPYLLDILDIDDAQRPGAVDIAARLREVSRLTPINLLDINTVTEEAGVEPTGDAFTPPNGFEDRAGHRTR